MMSCSFIKDLSFDLPIFFLTIVQSFPSYIVDRKSVVESSACINKVFIIQIYKKILKSYLFQDLITLFDLHSTYFLTSGCVNNDSKVL